MHKLREVSYLALVLCLFCGAEAMPQAKKVAQQVPQKNQQAQGQSSGTSGGLSDGCKTCLNLFSHTTLTFTSNAAKCAQIMPTCKGKPAGVCESIIDSCFNFNCTAEGACTDETANRGLFSGCLKAESLTLPFTCASYTAGKASSFAAMKRNEQAERARMHERDMQQAQLRSQEQQAVAEAEAQKARAATEAQTAQQRLNAEQQRFRQEQDARDAEIQRQRKAEQDRQNSRPHVMFNTAVSDARKAINSARTVTSGLITMMGIQTTTQAAGGGNMLHTPAPTFEAQGFAGNIVTDAKTRSFVMASKYGRGGIFRCTRDVRENVARAELDRALSTMTQARNTLAQAITNLEMVGNDPDTPQSAAIDAERINSLFEVQNSITSAITQIQTSTALMTTSCETRCNGMSSMLADTSGPSEVVYGADGTASVKAGTTSGGPGYVCKDFDTTNAFDPLALLGKPGSLDVESMLGGVSKRVGELTQRVLTAVVTADRAIEMAEIATNLGRSVEDWGDEDQGGGGERTKSNEKAINDSIIPNDRTGTVNNIARVIKIAIADYSKNPTTATHTALQNLINAALETLSVLMYNVNNNRRNDLPCVSGLVFDLPKFDKNKTNLTVSQASRCVEGIQTRASGSGGGGSNTVGECPDNIRRFILSQGPHMTRNDAENRVRNEGVTGLDDILTCLQGIQFVQPTN